MSIIWLLCFCFSFSVFSFSFSLDFLWINTKCWVPLFNGMCACCLRNLTVFRSYVTVCEFTSQCFCFSPCSAVLFTNGGHPIDTRNTIHHVISDFTWRLTVIRARVQSAPLYIVFSSTYYIPSYLVCMNVKREQCIVFRFHVYLHRTYRAKAWPVVAQRAKAWYFQFVPLLCDG